MKSETVAPSGASTMAGSVPNHITIVIPFCSWNDWVLECLAGCDKLEPCGSPIEIWLLPDATPTDNWRDRLVALALQTPIRIEPTGPGNPARKRNVALRASSADVFALIDSDAYPRPDWLRNGVPLLRDDVTIVAGPNLTPPGDPLMRRVPGRVMESRFGFGNAYIRHRPVSRRFVREMPTCNMLIRRQPGLLFREDLNTGEDMTFCSAVQAQGMRILYDPDVVVFHHRRSLGLSFIAQFYAYGLDKGRLARAGSDIAYPWQAAPAALLAYLASAGVVNAFPVPIAVRLLTFVPLLSYVAVVLVDAIRLSQSPSEFLLAPVAFLCAHIAYGAGYLRGLGTRPRVGS